MNNFPLTKSVMIFQSLNQEFNNHQLVYFDNAATTQKPQSVIDGISNYYKSYNANIHRGIHSLAEKATEEFEETRSLVKEFINASSENEIIFTRGTTEGINLISSSLSKFYFNEGDEIIISEMEHHSNIVPWQMIADENKLNLKIINVSENGEIDMDHFNSLISEKTKLVSIVYISNTLGTINPVKKIIEKCKENNILSVVDGAQSSAHKKIDVTDLNCDFYVFSAHKMYGPTGVGVVYGKEEILEKMPPYMGGGEMISDVTFSKTTYADLPHKFEAGTPNISGVIAFGRALDYLNEIGLEKIENYENHLLDYANSKLKQIEGLKIYGESKNKTSVISFNIEGIHSYDIGALLDKFGIAVRTGQHCAQPIMDHFGVDGTVRASFSFINTFQEIDDLIEALKKVKSMLS